MKIRLYFVSNSSSTSSIVLASEEIFNKTYDSLMEVEKYAIKDLINDGIIGKTKVKGISYPCDLNGEATDDEVQDNIQAYLHEHPEDRDKFDEIEENIKENDDDEPYFSTWQIIERFENKISENAKSVGEDVFMHTEGRG